MSHRNMIFTSAGDNTRFTELWCSKVDQNYDIYVLYYGNNDVNFQLYESHVTFIEKSEGSKFQNFHKFWNAHPEIIDKYDRFFILDDDIQISVQDINKMFDISREYNLEICAPSFNHAGGSIISHPITKNKKNTLLTYTNFVEVNTPLFNRTALDNLMKMYDPVLIGYGIDYLYIIANGIKKQTSYAIIHSIQCINPKTTNKKYKTREISKVPNSNSKEKIWRNYAKEKNIPGSFNTKNYSDIPMPIS